MIFEQTMQIIIMMALLDRFMHKGLEYACFSIMFAATAAEVLSFLYSFTLYRLEKRRSKIKVINDARIDKKILGIFVPVAASSYLRSGLRTAENILIPMGLKQFGTSHKDALSQYGLLIGMVMPLLLFPSAFLSAIATLLIPEITEAHTLHDDQKVQRTVSRVFKMTLLFSLLFCGIFVFFAYDVGLAVYQNREAGGLLMVLSPLLPLIYLDFLVDGMLNGLNKQMRTLKINILDYSLRIILIVVLIPKFGLQAFIAVMYVSTVLNAFLSIYSLVQVSRIKVRFINWIAKPLLCVLTAGSLATLIFGYLPDGVAPALSLALKVILTVGLYCCFLFMVRCLTAEDVRWFKSQVKRKRNEELVMNNEE
jgi:stage V sporulation protein B